MNTFRRRICDACIADSPVFSDRPALFRAAFAACGVDGWVAEFGVYKCGTLRTIASHFAGEIVHGFDSFEGLQEHWFGPKNPDNTLHTVGAYKVPNYEELQFPNNSEIHVGLVQNTVPEFIAEQTGPAKFMHIDTDTYLPAAAILQICNDRIVPGTVIQFDEFFGYPGWENHEARAFVEWLMRENRDAVPIGRVSAWQLAVKIA